MQFVSIEADIRYPVEHWVSEAPGREDILYFSIFIDQEPVGQILLHDLNIHAGESLVAYHLFRPELRGQGLGTLALRLLQTYVRAQTALKKLIIITSRDNLASQQIAGNVVFSMWVLRERTRQ
jgi:RimJ/RimL family protein N-acetyltransferase